MLLLLWVLGFKHCAIVGCCDSWGVISSSERQLQITWLQSLACLTIALMTCVEVCGAWPGMLQAGQG